MISKRYYIDTHCHLQDPRLENNLDTIDNDIFLINVGVNLYDARDFIIKNNLNHPFSVGVHPLYLQDNLTLDKLIIHDDIIAIGETGLDFLKATNISEQISSLILHIEAAIHLNVPIILHCRECEDYILPILKKYPQLKILFHCYSMDLSFTRKVLELPNKYLYFSFSPILTFKKAVNILESMMNIPIDKILTETDAPFLHSNPNGVKSIVKFISKQRDILIDDLQMQIMKNTERLFSFVF